ncbi:MAG: hypothetical protein RJA99_3577 [Pseudomonadota bacterium]|jgi:hypothetical protein
MTRGGPASRAARGRTATGPLTETDPDPETRR